MKEKLVTLREYGTLIEAELDKQNLEDAQIPVFLAESNTANTYAGLGPISSVELQVFEEDRQKALELLDKTQEDNG